MEFHYKSIINTVNGVAYRYKVDKDDLLSEVNNSLSRPTSYFIGEKDEDFVKWVYTIARNSAINILRKEAKQSEFIVRSDDEQNEKREDYKGYIVQPDVGHKELLKQITDWAYNKYLHKKPNHFRVIFEKWLLEDLKYEEMAMEAKIPVGTVKTTIHVIRKDITKIFGKKYETLLD